ncbi:hypothetical protein LWI29_031629 [Acer saccharum]|uniref:Uncharacterized protein n=1 Tax=Acer saccharum TaxID=4024 RepID=A0AA39TA56_ACESA|nr:hypothetical protein LWI29_031629 [Acer saccharum]
MRSSLHQQKVKRQRRCQPPLDAATVESESHENNEISAKAVKILKKYWDLEEGEEQNQQQGLTFDNIELNLPPGGSCKQIRLLVIKDCIESLCDFLDYPDPRTVKVCLEET